MRVASVYDTIDRPTSTYLSCRQFLHSRLFAIILLLLPLLELSREVLVVVVQHIAVTRKPTYRSHEEDLEIAASEIINCIKS